MRSAGRNLRDPHRQYPEQQDRYVVAVWFATRALVFLAAWIGGLALLQDNGSITGYFDLWNRWETPYYLSIAEGGYFPTGEFANNAAYFPGLALIIKAGLLVGISAPVTGMVVALIAGLAASLALSRLTNSVGGNGVWGVVAWTIAPVAVFIAAPWAEALFAGLAFWAWWKARQGAWLAAGLLAGGAALVRINGLFLGVALIVLFLLSGEKRNRSGIALLAPFVVIAGYFAYLWSQSGDWKAWFTAQSVGWDRNFHDPVSAFLNTYRLIFEFNEGVGAPHSRFVIEILAVAALLALGVVMAIKRWWPEAIFVLLTVGSLATSTYYYSVPRTAVVLFPVWMLIGLWLSRRRWLGIAYVVIGVPVLVLVSMRFAQGQWIS
jgi:hypothetical protein